MTPIALSMRFVYESTLEPLAKLVASSGTRRSNRMGEGSKSTERVVASGDVDSGELERTVSRLGIGESIVKVVVKEKHRTCAT